MMGLSDRLVRQCPGVITQLQTWRTDVAVVKVQFVAAFECGTAALLFCSQEFSAPLSGSTKKGEDLKRDMTDYSSFIFKRLFRPTAAVLQL